MITFTVFGNPTPKARPRHTKAGHTYTDPRTVAYETSVGMAAMVAHVELQPGRVPYTLRVHFYLSKRYFSTDLSNLTKAVEDGLQLYGKAQFGWDDGQIVGYRECKKILCDKGGERAVVTLWEAL
jgi:Holliday junction resolvase RusA-like endonuclease